MGKHILVIGATLMDVKGKPTAGLEPSTSNPANIRMTRGGTARNVAENLGRLGADVVLITAVGDDVIGDLLLDQTAEAGVDVDYALQDENGRTGGYIREELPMAAISKQKFTMDVGHTHVVEAIG